MPANKSLNKAKVVKKNDSLAKVRKKLEKIAAAELDGEEISSDDIKPINSQKNTDNGNECTDFYFGLGDGKITLVGQDNSVLNLKGFGEPEYSAKDWNLVVKEIDVIPLEDKIGKVIDLPKELNRGILIGPDGYRLDFGGNIEKITVAKAGSKGPKNQDARHMFLMGVPAPATGWIVVVESSKVINLADADDFIVLNPENSGILIGPDGNEVDFSKISALKLCEADEIYEDEYDDEDDDEEE